MSLTEHSRRRWIAALLAVGLAAGSVFAQSEARRVARLRAAFAREAKSGEDFDRRLEALRSVEPLSERIVETLVAVYDRMEREAKPIEERRDRPLQSGGGSARLVPLRDALQRLRSLQDVVVAVVTRARGEPLVRLVGLALGRKRLPTRLAHGIVGSAQHLEAGEADVVFDKLTKSSSREVVVLALAAVAAIGPAAHAAGNRVVELLGHEDVDVAVQAVRALEALRWPASLPAMIDRLDGAEGRLRRSLIGALRTLTGANPGAAVASWRLWLEHEGRAMVEGKAPLAAADAAEASAQPEPQLESVPGATGSYFGIPQDGDAILYVVDASQSMRQPGAGTSDETRMERCQRELHRALDALPRGKRFNLITFANGVVAFDTAMQEATPDNLRRAHEWVDAIQLQYQTNVYDALDLAFRVAGRRGEDDLYPLEADTILFLSDGEPTRRSTTRAGMQPDSADEILAAVHRWNPLRRIVVHVVALGVRPRAERPRNFLRRLAQENGGRFVER